jgi:hypothetical protein
MAEDRIAVLKRMAENLNVHDSNRDFLRLIVEELSMLRYRTETSDRVLKAMREAF